MREQRGTWRGYNYAFGIRLGFGCSIGERRRGFGLEVEYGVSRTKKMKEDEENDDELCMTRGGGSGWWTKECGEEP